MKNSGSVQLHQFQPLNFVSKNYLACLSIYCGLCSNIVPDDWVLWHHCSELHDIGSTEGGKCRSFLVTVKPNLMYSSIYNIFLPQTFLKSGKRNTAKIAWKFQIENTNIF
jgi:hypothetical protein